MRKRPDEWMTDVIDAGMNVFGIGEAAVTRLETLGYRRRVHAGGMLTLDFSGWAIFVHAEAPDESRRKDLRGTILRAETRQ